MNNKEQLLYYFMQGKISLSQYDYKFMSNLQTMIRDKNRVTTNQAELFDNLISKYKRQLNKNGLVNDSLKSLPWKTPLVESTSEYTGATVFTSNDDIKIRVPFSKVFISKFRDIPNNGFEWDKETKLYVAPFNTVNLKIAVNYLPTHFSTVRYSDDLETIIDTLKKYEAAIYNPTLKMVNGVLMIVAINEALYDATKDMELNVDQLTLFRLNIMGVNIDPDIYKNDEGLRFAANRVVEAELVNIESVIHDMKALGCKNVLIGRGLRTGVNYNAVEDLVRKNGMTPFNSYMYGSLTNKHNTQNKGITMLLQTTTQPLVPPATAMVNVNKVVILKDSRNIGVK